MDNCKGKSTGLKEKTNVKPDQKAVRKRAECIRTKKKKQRERKQKFQMNGFSVTPQGQSYGLECLSTDIFRIYEVPPMPSVGQSTFAAFVHECGGYMRFKCHLQIVMQKRKEKE